MPMTEKLYQKVAIEDPTGRWEFNYGHLRSKPAMSNAHLFVSELLVEALYDRVARPEYMVGTDGPRLRTSNGNYYVPDVCVYPRRLLEEAVREAPRRFQVFDEPVPFVAEVWSPSTGDCDAEEKIPEYQRRGELEIWLLHRYDKTVRRWTRRRDGSYEESLLRGGRGQLAALPAVSIEVASLFGEDTSNDDRDQ